jgi:hypothetical protein
MTNPIRAALTWTPPSATEVIDEVGYTGGLLVGEAVTVALRFLPSWSKPVVDEAGKPVLQVPGASQVGDRPIEERHKQLVGPMITEFASTLSHGYLRDALEAFGRGATDAPGETYRLGL